ncbi:MAG: ABC transporter permease, partial [Thermaceae bacterium]
RYALFLSALLTFALGYLAPWAVPNRAFGGEGALLNPFGGLVPPGSLPEAYRFEPSLWAYPFVLWVLLIALASSLRNPRPYLLPLAFGGLLLFLFVSVSFYLSVHAVNQEALAQGISPRRLPLRRYALSLGTYALFLEALFLLLLHRLLSPGGLAALVRRRGVVVPLAALGLSSLVGGGVVAFLRPGLGQGETLREGLMLKLDLVTYTFQLLYSPLVSPSGFLQALLLTTPLIFTGLSVALAFRAGLFNIGAPGQLILGAIAAMLVGVYLPGPRWLVLPLAILAAGLAGALWGAIPGFLKARFGAHEVINTIMLNYVASSLLLFLISANEYKFFGQSLYLPFKYPGYEARSHEIRPEARIPHWTDLIAPGGHLSLALPLGGALALAGYFFLRKTPGHRALGAVLGFALGYLLGGVFAGPGLEISPSLSSVRLNGAFLLALAAAFLVHLLVFKTSFGYELRAMGLSPKAAEYGGVALGRRLVLAMALAGALAGLAATHYVLGGGIDEYRLKQSLPYTVGFDGIAVALMGQNTPLGVVLSAFLFGVLLTGGLQLNLQLGISRELVAVLQALVVLFIAGGGFLPRYFTDPLRAAEMERKEV